MNQVITQASKLTIIDSQVNNWQFLAKAISNDSLVLILDSSSDGLSQISQFLTDLKTNAGDQDLPLLQSIHIISDGEAGSLWLGSSTVMGNDLDLYSEQLATIGHALTENGDILLYGCNVAAGEAGLKFINRFADLTQADIAASSDLTGSSGLGGDWQLERTTGTIEASSALNKTMLARYTGLLEGIGYDNYIGGDGIDTIKYTSATTSITVNLSLGFANGQDIGLDVLTGIENLIGGQAGDLLIGNAGNNSIDGFWGDDTLEGGERDDTLIGGAGNDSVDAGEGDDVLIGSEGKDTYTGGVGTDIIDYSNISVAIKINLERGISRGTGLGNQKLFSIENIIGGRSDDHLIGDTGTNVINGGIGNDTIETGAGDDVLIGSQGNDTYSGGAGTDTINYSNIHTGITLNLEQGTANGELGNQQLFSIENIIGSQMDDRLIGDAGNNVIDGSIGNDSLKAGAGDDVLIGSQGNDTYSGGAGTDTINYSNIHTGITLNLEQGTANGKFGSQQLFSIENIIGGQRDDRLIGDAGDNVIDGIIGNDTIMGGAGNDVLIGSDGDNLMDGGSGRDIVDAGGGNDKIISSNSDVAIDIYIGGSGTDTLLYTSNTTGITVNLEQGKGYGNQLLFGIENITGSQSDDNLAGDSRDNLLDGSTGNDTFAGGAGNDTIIGGVGNDYIIGGNGFGDDDYVGGTGVDTIKYSSAISSITVNLDSGKAKGNEIGSDRLVGIENIIGGQVGDSLTGNGSSNVIDGFTGNDTLNGGAGNDTLRGGDGNDLFLFNTAVVGTANIDRIIDFAAPYDNIDLAKQIFTKLTATGVLDARQFVTGTAALDANDYIIYNPTTGAVTYDSDGSGLAQGVQFATLGVNLNITNANFVII